MQTQRNATEGLPGVIPLYTRLGTEIENHQDRDHTPDQVERSQALHRKKSPFVVERRPPTCQYNCHGLTFANRRTGIYNPPDVDTILKDDGLRRIRLSEEVQVGDVAVYSDGTEVTHTGIVVEVIQGEPEGSTLRAVKLLSKWGGSGEYIHLANEGPYAREGTVKYWTDRP